MTTTTAVIEYEATIESVRNVPATRSGLARRGLMIRVAAADTDRLPKPLRMWGGHFDIATAATLAHRVAELDSMIGKRLIISITYSQRPMITDFRIID